jgi:hypothetical protein
MPRSLRRFRVLALVLVLSLLTTLSTQCVQDDIGMRPARAASWITFGNENDADAGRFPRRIYSAISYDAFDLPLSVSAPVRIESFGAAGPLPAKHYRLNLVLLI